VSVDVLAVNAKVLDGRARERVEVGRGLRLWRAWSGGFSIIGGLPHRKFVRGPLHERRKGPEIVNSSVEYCVILENASIISAEGLGGSLIGRNAKIVKGEGSRRFVKPNV
jgi:hypothetical protein